MNKIQAMPEFTDDSSQSVEGTEETVQSDQTTGEELVEKEKETPAEPPADSEETAEAEETEQKPAESEPYKADSSDDTVAKELEALKSEKTKLIQEIQSLRGQKREVKQSQIDKVEDKISELKDVHPQDVELIEKVLRSKGYVTKEEAQGMSYKATQQQKVDEFLNEFPEYKPENDPNDVNWNALQRALSIYAKPSDPNKWAELLKRAHKDIAPSGGDRTLEAKKRQVKTAGVGGSGVQKSSSRKTLPPEKKQVLLDGGFTEEDIANMEKRL